MVSIIILYYNIMGPPSCMWSVVDRNAAHTCIYKYGRLLTVTSLRADTVQCHFL